MQEENSQKPFNGNVGNENPFYRLAPFIQEYIYAHKWTELRAAQVEACRVIFDTDAHLLLASGTASGKTEAAFLPVLTLLHENPSATVGVLYIGPTKALINDQFLRLNDHLKEADMPVWHWHGDVSQSEKTRAVKNPRGVLQITPESIESLLINKKNDLMRLFGDLRFVIIDEIHSFMGSERGRQILCQLERLSVYMRNTPRRIGLSATLGDYSIAEAWLASGTDRRVITPQVQSGHKSIRLSVEHFIIPKKDRNMHATGSDGKEPDENAAEELEVNSYWDYIFGNSSSKKCIIFTNSRFDAEEAIATLRQMAEKKRLPDIYYVHHGNISAPLREAAEIEMRNVVGPRVVAATTTLELGIDIGELERVLQLRAPYSVASFLQRLGRSGRRGAPSEMLFVSREDEPAGREMLYEQIPWQLLQSIAVIQLYLEERWIEPIKPPVKPFSLLYHQTMSILASSGELSPQALAKRVLTLSPFNKITLEEYRQLLNYLISIDHIQQTEEKGLIVGLAGEKVINNFRFYAVFPEDEEYSVRYETREIGCVSIPFPVGERFALAGQVWEVVDSEIKKRTIFVKPVKGKIRVTWTNDTSVIHTKILERMRRVLFEDVQYPYLQPGALKRLSLARRFARQAELDKHNIFSSGGHTLCIFPWVGTHAYRALYWCVRHYCKEMLGLQGVGGYNPYYMIIQAQNGNPDELLNELLSICRQDIYFDELLDEREIPMMQRYDEFLPPALVKNAYIHDQMDAAELRTVVQDWKCGRYSIEKKDY